MRKRTIIILGAVVAAGVTAATIYAASYLAISPDQTFSTLPATSTSTADTTAPTMPTSFQANAFSQSQINLLWGASTDNVGVTQYVITRNGTQIATTAQTSYSDTGLTAATSYTYTVVAKDAAGNSSPVATTSATTQSASVAGNPANPANVVTITDQSGQTTSNYPVQIGRPFVQGEIANYPQAIIGGLAVPTQADVKERWPDGSVKHAILSFLIPTLTANGSVQVTFQNQSSGNNTPLTKAQMLDASYNFDAQMLIASGTQTLTADARQMLSNGSYMVWTSGQIAQTVILSDNSTARQYDLGFDSYKPFRPIFEATFWPSTHQVWVRYVGEEANTADFEDMPVSSLTLTLGSTTPQTVYTQSNLTFYAGSRWTKDFWLNGTPGTVNINHNLAYLVKTDFVYNYDTALTASATNITNFYSYWTGAAKNLYDAGNLQKSMGAGGARYEIGPFPDYDVLWLYSGDYRMYQMSKGNAELAAAFPMHFREGVTGKDLLTTDPAGGSTGFGHILSITNRPSVSLAQLTYSYTAASDKVTIVGPVTNGSWTPDVAHTPDMYTPLYTLTGDYFYLEELWFWSSWEAAESNGAAIHYWYGRGPTGAEGALDANQLRAMAWTLRTRANTAFVSPDNTPEKTYFNNLMADAIAAEDGAHNLTSSTYYGNTEWNWAKTYRFPFYSMGGALPPLHQYWVGSANFAQTTYGINPSTTQQAMSQFELDYMMIALGRAKELGYPTEPLLNYLGQYYIGKITDPSSNPWQVGNGRAATVKADGTYFSSWSDLNTAYSLDMDNFDWSNPTGWGGTAYASSIDGYPFLVMAGVSYVANEPGGSTAWNWISANAPLSAQNDDPKWAIIPR